ncbi:unnamed protein product [Arctogadus glacialis]
MNSLLYSEPLSSKREEEERWMSPSPPREQRRGGCLLLLRERRGEEIREGDRRGEVDVSFQNPYCCGPDPHYTETYSFIFLCSVQRK